MQIYVIIQRYWLIMRLTTVLLIATLMQVSAAGFAQRLTMQKTQVSLKEVFIEIKKQTGYNVVWDSELLKNSKPVEAKFDNEEVCKVLDQILVKQNLDYTITDNTIVIKENKKPSFLEIFFDRFNNIDVSGKILDENSKPLPGASVKVKKTGKGVSTDKDGRFFLRGVEEGAVLVVSFIGYLPKEVSASANMGSVVLEQSLSKLDEVQVIAYGTTTQRLSTGNVTTIKADVIEKQPVNNPLLALQGRVPGLFIEQATGFAGTGVKVRIQGQNSIFNGNEPFYVIDGIPFPSQLLPGDNGILNGAGGLISGSSPLNFITPSDIESIDILKDADATAIYGSRAANGAILITTKRGKVGDTKVNLNLQSGWAKVPRELDLMNSQQYLEMRREALRNDGIVAPALGPYVDNDLNGNWDNTRYTDWQKELIGGIASYQDINASISGGNDRTTFLIGASHHRETNVFPNDFSDNKTSVRFSINNTSVNQRFKIEFSGSYLFDNNRLPITDLTNVARTLAPVAPELYTPDGYINWAPNASGNSTFAGNPIRYLFDNSSNNTSNLMSNMNLSYQIMPGLEIKSLFGYNKLNSNIIYKRTLQSIPPESLPYAQRSTTLVNNETNSWSIEPQLTYSHNLSKGKLEVLLGTTISKSMNLGSGIVASGFSNDLVMEDILSATSIRAGSSTNSLYKYNAAFGRINYNWQDKYILNITGRRDGSSRFGPKSQFHNFAAVGGAWIFSNESLIKDHLAFLSFGKLRASYGTTGSDQIGDYRFLSLYDPLQQDITYQGVVAYQPNRLTNPYLEWEETHKLQFGLDLGFLKDRILLNANYYRNRSSNQLSFYVLPATTGFQSIDQNLTDKVENAGWDLTIASTNLRSKDFKWSSSINLTVPKTSLIQSIDVRFPTTVVVGAPLSAIKVYHFLGVDPLTGIYQFEDHNGNPTSTPDPTLDATVLLDVAPKFYGGIQNSFSYKGFQLDFLFSFVKQIAQNQLFGVNSFSPGSFGSGGQVNQLASLLDRWQKPGDISSTQRFSTISSDVKQALSNVKNSDAAWSDASYIRLKNVSLSWQLLERWSKSAHLQNCSLFVQGQNLWTFTNYKGLDPETKSSTSLPPLRVITIGLKATL
ncbi:SusC/RagA family TonB-linked outer membrane protein [Pedobacter sp. HMWF019]|uniref:SusC/RagA family TonB-linked outer membrane protein n=1 Tax=Pedobacter sp. HMWF019 TaxID=2056856 RepID=UPI000D3BA7B0|nr:SusC/RagA family TonB-linked outer membrane protein [Pedobacter sp. HMWF019]PTS95412.1 SusC/RagA family TonB-linked outer membrane protein [Pedobacter sp. HMWF019]